MTDTPNNDEVVATFEVRRRRVLDAAGRVVAPLPPFAADPKEIVALYRAMVRTRTLDARAVALQRSGQLGTYASSLGEEAVGVGVASAMRADDVLLPSFREHGAQLWRGLTPVEILLFWGGDERGSAGMGPRRDFPVAIPVASHAPHAVGVALACKLRGETRAAVCVLGDGATSKGDFYEALNAAGVWRVPLVFVIANNQWAISLPRAAQSAAATLAQKAIAAGIPGEQVDGNDVLAVRAAVDAALARARGGEGPTVVEALTYRLADHTTADDARRYRDEAALRDAWVTEPIARLRDYLVRTGAWTSTDEDRLVAECRDETEAAVGVYLRTPAQAPETMFDHLFAVLPAELGEQRTAACALAATEG